MSPFPVRAKRAITSGPTRRLVNAEMRRAGRAGRSWAPAAVDTIAEMTRKHDRADSFTELRDRLLLGPLETRVGARGVVGDVDDAADRRNSPGDGYSDALAEGDRGRAAALAPPRLVGRDSSSMKREAGWLLRVFSRIVQRGRAIGLCRDSRSCVGCSNTLVDDRPDFGDVVECA